MKITTIIKDIMYGDKCVDLSPMAIFLFILSFLYGMIVRFRNALYSWGIIESLRLPCIVISVGNLTVGGTGKTPMTIHVAKLLNQFGYTVAVISRGYGGDAEKTGAIISDGRSLLMDVDAAGDEPTLMAVHLKNIPVLVGKHRFEMSMIAKKKFNCDIIILDDAFQHRKLKRDIDLVLLDSTHPLGNTYMFPRGTLREPVKGLIRADAYIMTRSDPVTHSSLNGRFGTYLRELFTDRTVFKTYHIPYCFTVENGVSFPLETINQKTLSDDLSFLREQKVLAFSGIAGNQYFRRTVENTKCILYDFMEFPDHYQYSNADLDHIAIRAKKLNVDYIMTTEKDYMRIYKNLPWKIDLVVVGVKIAFEDDSAFQKFIKNNLDDVQNSKKYLMMNEDKKT